MSLQKHPTAAPSALPTSASELIDELLEARRRTLALVSDLDDDQLMGSQLDIVNPLLWEIGHVAWFQERWTRRHLRGEPSLAEDADALYDSMAVAHDTRWDLPLYSRKATGAYMQRVLDDVVEHLNSAGELTPDDIYFHRLALFHEDMHAEAFAYTRQTHGYPAPAPAACGVEDFDDKTQSDLVDITGDDVEITGGVYLLGASPEAVFAFDNEKWAHEVEIAAFAIARTAVTQGQFRTFVNDGGYDRRELWSPEGWRWCRTQHIRRPAYWRRDRHDRWERRVYDCWQPIADRLPMVHVNAFEAEAYCRWAKRRLPTEAEWELAAASTAKTNYPWGNEPIATRANLDGRYGGPIAVDRLAVGETPAGVRQMMGNVWEWTATAFGPYLGFVADPYKDYSEPWFGNHQVLRGGCWATRFHMLRNTWRNFYTPDRRDVWAGFRTCALER